MARSSGYRTRNREMMLAYLKENRERTVYASDIRQHMIDQGANVNITTIYRFLDKLQEEHKVLKYASDKGESTGFQYIDDDTGCEDHLHVKCACCGRVVHLNCGFMDEIKNHLKCHHNFELQCSGSSLFGICENCREKETNHS